MDAQIRLRGGMARNSFERLRRLLATLLCLLLVCSASYGEEVEPDEDRQMHQLVQRLLTGRRFTLASGLCIGRRTPTDCAMAFASLKMGRFQFFHLIEVSDRASDLRLFNKMRLHCSTDKAVAKEWEWAEDDPLLAAPTRGFALYRVGSAGKQTTYVYRDPDVRDDLGNLVSRGGFLAFNYPSCKFLARFPIYGSPPSARQADVSQQELESIAAPILINGRPYLFNIHAYNLQPAYGTSIFVHILSVFPSLSLQRQFGGLWTSE
jgi:hypothetical protein